MWPVTSIVGLKSINLTRKWNEGKFFFDFFDLVSGWVWLKVNFLNNLFNNLEKNFNSVTSYDTALRGGKKLCSVAFNSTVCVSDEGKYAKNRRNFIHDVLLGDPV